MDTKKKAMSDGEVNNKAFSQLMGDLDGIEAEGMFSEDKAPQDSKPEGVKMEAGGYSIHVKPMNGEQVKDRPTLVPEDDEEPLDKFGL